MGYKNKADYGEWRRRVRIEAVQHYGGQCACCGETKPVFLALDHIHHGKGNPAPRKRGEHLAESLRRDGWPEGIQVLCHNCNMTKSILGYCPHQE